jgi:hypothetical protein
MRCYCSICRKTDGGDHIGVFNAVIDGRRSSGERRFCRDCGTALWVWDPGWPELVHPFASAIDTPLPVPPQTVHILLDDKPDWVVADIRAGDETHPGYPDKSLRDWHEAHGLLS